MKGADIAQVFDLLNLWKSMRTVLFRDLIGLVLNQRCLQTVHDRSGVNPTSDATVEVNYLRRRPGTTP